MLRASVALLLAVVPSFAASWSWAWQPDHADPTPAATIATFKYGKTWAYAVEIDDGPKWIGSFAVPFLARHHFTDAPPGVTGGRVLPFVGSVAAIAASVGVNDASANWEDLAAVSAAGWGVINHSYDHRGYGWEPKGALTDQEVTEDAWWSQTIFAANLPGGRAPAAVAYANGYTDYNRHDALAKAGIIIATRVGGGSPRDVASPKLDWMDFTRSYLDEGVWTNQWSKSAPMADFPGGDADGPAAGSFVIDFTHVIEQKPDSPNQQRWLTRLNTIEQRWGAGGADTLWCAPTADVAAYVQGARAAKVTVARGRLTVTLPDNLPGTALTLKLSGIAANVKLAVPRDGALYRQGETVYLTTPLLGQPGAAPPEPRVRRIYDGPAVSTDFAKPAAIAGVTFRYGGCPPKTGTCRVALKTAAGVQPLGSRAFEGGKWVFGTALCPLLPTKPAVVASGVVVEPIAEVRQMTVWALADAPA